MSLRLLFLLAFTTPVSAEIIAVPYSDLRLELSNTLTFETLPQRPEPGFNLDHPLRSAGAWVGEHFAGQSMAEVVATNGSPHDALGHAFGHRPLSVQPGLPNRNLSIAFHRGFGSNAILPLGPDGFDRVSGRGEGALAVVFDTDQMAVGFRVHTDYAAPLGNIPSSGDVRVHFFTRQGYPIETKVLTPGRGISEFGFRVTDGPILGGMVVTNTDPGGIAIDDILFQIDLMLF
ncbi:hypothetical protein SAMN05444000_10355 [Shimia gijangensis]|uniref:Uncharacterized protein n=1 Tax=Shimia gijangensis TaxID=1470563 RepID=A0A1M6DZ51_9RHOB|nr:hypothetical protein [Shimia gijangensis]SHI78506.1 hypothetical protein SAMN05444000_10355 [Shimia gijangensis]